MANLTITVDDEALKQARVRALMQNTSVNAILRDFLESYAGVRTGQRAAVATLLSLSRSAKSGRGSRRWTRDDLHDRR